MPSSTLKSPGSLTKHLIDFCRFLRSKDFQIGSAEEVEVLKVLAKTPFTNLDNFRLLLKAILCKNHQHQFMFNDLFYEFWQELFTSFDSKVKISDSKAKTPASKKTPPNLSEIKAWLFQHDPQKQEEAAFYSPGKPQKGTLTDYQADQIGDLVKIIQRFNRDWANRKNRRFAPSKNEQSGIDLRKSMRKNIHRGEIMELAYRTKKIQKLNLVLLCDVSRSMELFSKFTVQMLYAFQNNYGSIDTFVFGTQLIRISPWLKQYSFEESLKKLSENLPDWSGGTRIGYSLQQFIQGYGAQLLNKRTMVLVVSDGWDTGEVELMAWSTKYIQRRVKKLIWFNPQAGKPNYKPEVAGMKAAMPYIDIFHGVHNLQSLKMWQQSGYKSR